MSSNQEPFEDAHETVSDAMPSPLPQGNSTRSLTNPSPTSGSPAHPPSLPPRSPPAENEKQDYFTDDPGSDNQSDPEDTPRKQKLQKSPLLTAHRLSTSSLDDVNLAGNKEDEEDESSGQNTRPVPSPPPVPARDSMSSHHSNTMGLSGALPSVPWAPPPPIHKNSPPSPPAPAPPPPPTRKFTSPFAWLTRSSTTPKETKPPQHSTGGHRSTAASVSTMSSNADHLARLPEDDVDGVNGVSKKQKRSSLKDQFKILRMREEGPIAENDVSSIASGNASSRSPRSIQEEGESHVSTPQTSPSAVTVNPSLPPGTVSGISTSATDASAPVDWELWQQLVNEGPTALTGANSEELHAAIKRGIPQTIRGVIWQVMADSRNPELEEVYRELVARGTDKEKEHLVNGNDHPSSGNASDKDKESMVSSRSSVHSDNSGTVGRLNNGTSSPSHEQDLEKLAKEHAAREAAQQKKAKEQAAALQKLEKTIRRDLGARTSYSRYFISQGNQDALFGLCKAYALYDEAVGYAQGMNFIAMPLLFNVGTRVSAEDKKVHLTKLQMDEAEAFTLLVKLMNKYGLREMFVHEMPGLHRSLYLFERLLEDLEPALYCHLRRREVPPQLYATQWFLTLFAYRFPLQLVLRIYDLVFEEGLESAILRFAVAIMRRNADTLLGMKDMSPLTSFLKERLFDVYIDKQPSPSSILESGFFGSSGAADKEVYRADIMVQDACAIPLTKEMVKEYTSEWEEKCRVEKERELELETLKQTVTKQAARIRMLEERTETSDKEHVQLASELVRLKVENEELEDLTDALKIQVQELKNVVDKQPEEVEAKLRTEMDRIMQRNVEVQNENRAMEEQIAEMEKELVDAKMKWAEVRLI